MSQLSSDDIGHVEELANSKRELSKSDFIYHIKVFFDILKVFESLPYQGIFWYSQFVAVKVFQIIFLADLQDVQAVW